MNELKKVYVVQEYIPEYRVSFFRLLIERAFKSGISLRVVAGDPNSSQASRSDSAHLQDALFAPNREFRVGKLRVNLRMTARITKDADLIVFEQARRNFDLYQNLFFGRKKFALWGHGADFVQRSQNLQTKLLRYITNSSSWFFAYSNRGAELLAESGYEKSRITVVRNATDTRTIQMHGRDVRQEDVRNFRQQVENSEFIGLFVGALDESKRIDFLLESIREIKLANPEFSMIFVGDGPLQQMVTDFAKKNPWVKRFDRLVGPNLAAALKASDLLMMPGRVGLVAVDALALGLPVATTNWEFHAPEFEYLNGSNSIISNNSVSEYSQAVSNYISNPHAFDDLSGNARLSVDGLGIEAMADSFCEGLVEYFGANG
jgi:glycosyltransferase involved in cell wall biosynthesis